MSSVQQTDISSSSALFVVACTNGDVEDVKRFMGDVSLLKLMNGTCFSEACKNGHLEIVKLLDSLEIRRWFNFSGFRSAARFGHLEIVKFLDSPEAREADDFGGFREACIGGHLDVINYLMTKMTAEQVTEAGYGIKT